MGPMKMPRYWATLSTPSVAVLMIRPERSVVRSGEPKAKTCRSRAWRDSISRLGIMRPPMNEAAAASMPARAAKSAAWGMMVTVCPWESWSIPLPISRYVMDRAKLEAQVSRIMLHLFTAVPLRRQACDASQYHMGR